MLRAVVILAVVCRGLAGGKAPKNESFEVCGGDTSVITTGKAAKFGSRMIQTCTPYTVLRYGLPTKVLQKVLTKVCAYIHLCYHKHQPLKKQNKKHYCEVVVNCAKKLTIVAMKRFTEGFPENEIRGAEGLLIDGTKCLTDHNLLPDSPDVSLQCIRFVRSTFF
ncbi:uncharacterized protein LOC144167228 [Haemaphysalis longicornis]